MVNPAAFAPFNLAESYAQGLQIREHRQQQQDKKRLADLIPQAMGRGGISENGATDQRAAIEQMYGINPELAMKLDDRQREQAQHEIDDLSAAVRWADNPEKWAYVQQHFGQKGVDLSPYGFADRERGLVALGQIGSYLKDTPKPNDFNVEAGAGRYRQNPDGSVSVVIAPNPGDRPIGSPVGQPTQQAAPPPPPGFVIDGGPTQSASGNFPY